MFWHLLFAHFLADYPLQSNWMAARKGRPAVLALHAGIHLAAMLIVSGAAVLTVWPYLLALTAAHLAIDLLKGAVTTRWPAAAEPYYFYDQALHILTIAGAAGWIQQSGALAPPAEPLFHARLAVMGTGLLLVTFVWYITERILARRNPAYLREVVAQRWPRSVIRAGVWIALLAAATPHALLVAGVAAGSLPYLGKYARRSLLTDLVVVGIVFLWAQWALRMV